MQAVGIHVSSSIALYVSPVFKDAAAAVHAAAVPAGAAAAAVASPNRPLEGGVRRSKKRQRLRPRPQQFRDGRVGHLKTRRQVRVVGISADRVPEIVVVLGTSSSSSSGSARIAAASIGADAERGREAKKQHQ